MNRFRISFFLLLSVTLPSYGQLTQEQKVSDFMQLSGLYAKHYAPYEWKRDVIGFDLYDAKPWLEKVKATKNDLEFYDVCTRYVASLQDSHNAFETPSDFEAWAHMGVDVYDGKILIDSIDRTYLPAKSYPFAIGDEILSIDGKTPEEWITALTPYTINGSANPTSRRRLAINLAFDRYQAYWPMAVPSSDKLEILVKSQTGETATYLIPWQIYGTPLLASGSISNLRTAKRGPRTASSADGRGRTTLGRRGLPNDFGEADNPWGVRLESPIAPAEEPVPAYMETLKEFQTMQAVDTGGSVFPFDALSPVFNPPTGFKQRLGAARTDLFLSGTFPVGDRTVGFLRIPTFAPANSTTALTQLRTEVLFFQQNTDGLVIDVMGNGGGRLCYTESVLSYLIPVPFRSAAYNIRATQYWANAFSAVLANAKAAKADQWVIDLYTLYVNNIRTALSENRGMTGDIPICGPVFENIPPAKAADGTVLAYTKPILILTDNFTLSAAEAFSGFMQDAGRATVFGTRTDGGGGNPGNFTNATTYSEGFTRVTRTFVTRGKAYQTPGFPTTTYIENVGVYPDVVADYMTTDNLFNRGKTFVAAFSTAIANLIATGKP